MTEQRVTASMTAVHAKSRSNMWFFFAFCVAAIYVANVRPGAMTTEYFAMICVVAVLAFLGVADNSTRR